MKANVGSVDRVIRIVLGVVILGAGLSFKNWWGLIGLLPLLSGVFRFCVLYVPFGISTCETKPSPPPADTATKV